MALNYTRLRATAERLIEQNGRTLQLVRKTQNNAVDPTKPWRAQVTTSDITINVIGVVVPYEAEQIDGTLIQRKDKQVYFAAKSVSDAAPANLNLEDYDAMVDGGVRYQIIESETLEPGGQRIIYTLQVRQ